MDDEGDDQEVITRLAAAAALVAALILGMLATAPTASADCPYSACLATSASAQAKVKTGQRAKIKVAVAGASNLAPTGQVTVTIVKRPGGKVLTRTLTITGGQVDLKTRKLKPGKYSVTVTYVPTAGSVWQGTTTTTTFKVKKRR